MKLGVLCEPHLISALVKAFFGESVAELEHKRLIFYKYILYIEKILSFWNNTVWSPKIWCLLKIYI